MERRWSVHVISALSALRALVLVAPGRDPAEGAIPNAGGTYSACLTKATGAIEVIDYPKVKCAKGQRLIRWSQQGPQGAQGAQGPAGPADWDAIPNKPAGFADGVDDAGVTGVKLTRVIGQEVQVAPSSSDNAVALCPAGAKLTGGGHLAPADPALLVFASFPNDGGWQVSAVNFHTGPYPIKAFAICMSVEPAGAFTTAKQGKLPASVKKSAKGRR